MKYQALSCLIVLMLASGCGSLIPTSTPTVTPSPTASLTPTATVTPSPTSTPTATPVPTVCGGPQAMFILVIGSDARQDTYKTGLADSIRIVRLDFVEPVGIRVLSFPRDLYVEIPGISDHNGITHGKLNQAYLYGNPGYGYFDGEGQGPGLLALTLKHNYGARVDRYAAVNLQTFVKIVDTLGGIDIDLPYAIDGRVPKSKDFSLVFPAGEQTLNGYRTMLLARLRPQGDSGRIEIQNLIMKALADKALRPSTLLMAPSLFESLDDSVQTDIGTADLRQLICLASLLGSDQVQFDAFPEDLFTLTRVQDRVLGNTSIVDANRFILRDYVRRFNNGAPLLIEEGEIGP